VGHEVHGAGEVFPHAGEVAVLEYWLLGYWLLEYWLLGYWLLE
jgi:hypothetical protein